MSEPKTAAPARPWLAPALIAVLVCAAYAPSLGAGFLGWDDDWLVEHNPLLREPSAPAAMLLDFSRDTRLVLGAEYLPVRDLVTWALVQVVGPTAPALRVALLALYVAAVLAWRTYFRRLLGDGARAELATLAFALHPVHVESVAWLAGIKDVLALLFTGVALATHASASTDARRRAIVVAAVLLACFSKAVSVVLPALLLITDAWLGRRPDRATIGSSAVVAAVAAWVHATNGAVVGMYAPMPGGDRVAAAATMAPVVWRYVARALLFEPASAVYDVPDRGITDPVALGALAGIAVLTAVAVWAARRGERRPLLALAFVAASLAPVSQVLAPIQNRMADRYLFVAIAVLAVGVGLAIGALASRRARAVLGAAIVLVLGVATAARAATFAEPRALWTEASERAPASPRGPYQLGASVEHDDPALAEQCYREAIARDAGVRGTTWCHAADNLAILLARSHREAEAIALLEDAHAHYPDDPHVGNNLAVLLDARGEHERARVLLLEVMRRSPRYAPARQTYRARWGEPP